MLEFALFVILGIVVFWAPTPPNSPRWIILLVIFVVLMLLWGLQLFGVLPPTHFGR